MLEKSMVSKQDIKSLLLEKYGIHEVDSIASLKGGSANCYHIQASQGEFVLKEFQSEYTVADVKMEPEINEFLRVRGTPTARLIPTKTGDHVWQFRNRAFHLQEHISGTIYPSNGAPDWLKWAKDSGGSEKQFVDALRVYEVQFGELDIDYLEHWAGELEIKPIWERLRSEAEIV